MTALVFYEGVLQSSKNQPIMDGFRLVQALVGGGMRLVIATSGTEARVEHQLRTERLMDWISEIIDKEAALEPLPLWARQIEVARSRYPVSMVITGDADIARFAVERGLVTLFFSHPGFSQPAQRPEQGNRSWEQLIDELDRRWS
jgi:hypothetical protein